MKIDPLHGLRFDLPRLAALAQRRHALRLLGGLGLAGGLPLLGGVGRSHAAAGTPASGKAVLVHCSPVPRATAGPFPGDGSNRVRGGLANALALSGIVRSDIRRSIGGASGTAAGVPLRVTLTLVNTGAACAALAGHAVYLWQNDRDGLYSMYSGGAHEQNYLRGVQVSDDAGRLSFRTIVPGCYPGRWPHLHFEVFRSLVAASNGGNSVLTSQLALPAAACEQVYASAGYGSSVARLAALSLDRDFVFGHDRAAHQMASISGSVAGGLGAEWVVGLAA